ncbi:lysR substrate binding domain protein [Candidatus Erwinia dacicola]|uniref:LysR substrate binding domain protein n=1 Tax=Candidatus Erwinia dacicola TaxID=252393 RepID=A0A328TNG4_9GAMM|nr:lysR substrate binding domain protein [Candidatus Erwinia dacicola]
MIRWLKSRIGIAYVPLMWIEEINAGEVEILFAHYQSVPCPVYAVYTQKGKLPLKVQVCINHLTEYFDKVAEIYREFHPKPHRRVFKPTASTMIAGDGLGRR